MNEPLYFTIAFFIWLGLTAGIVKIHKLKWPMFEDREALIFPIAIALIISVAWVVALPIIAGIAVMYGIVLLLLKVIK